MKPIPDYYKARFAKGAKSTSISKVYKTQREWEIIGLTTFKRRVLGLCGRQSTKSIDELAEILTALKVTDSREEGRKFVRGLYGKSAEYGENLNGYKTLEFTRAQDNKNREGCRINSYVYRRDAIMY